MAKKRTYQPSEDYLAKRKAEEDFVNSRLNAMALQRAQQNTNLQQPVQPAPGPQSSGFWNLVNILLGRSPIQQKNMGARTNVKR